MFRLNGIIFRSILSIPLNIAMGLNNVMVSSVEQIIIYEDVV